MVPLNSIIEDMSGSLELDDKTNKSGRNRFGEYPRYTSTTKSHVYLSEKEDSLPAYPRDQFFYEVDEFVFESIDKFDPSEISLPGRLVSGGILPTIEENITIMDDQSFGFSHATTSPISLYGQSGTFQGFIEFRKTGLTGKGVFSAFDLTVYSDSLSFYTDSLTAVADNITLDAKTGAYPNFEGGTALIMWNPKSDAVRIDSIKTLRMYDEFAQFNGEWIYTSQSLSGKGYLEWNVASLASNNFDFKDQIAYADSAELNIKSLDASALAFKTPSMTAKVDFERMVGTFKSLEENIPTEFPFNRFKTTMNEFEWDMVNNVMKFSTPNPSIKAEFTSTLSKSKKGGLNFEASSATYDLKTSSLNIDGIKQLEVANAIIYPDNETISIAENARIKPMSNATIKTSQDYIDHVFTNAEVTITGKKKIYSEWLLSIG